MISLVTFKILSDFKFYKYMWVSVSDVTTALVPDRSCLVWHNICDSVNMFVTPVSSHESDTVRYKYDVLLCLPPSFANVHFWVR